MDTIHTVDTKAIEMVRTGREAEEEIREPVEWPPKRRDEPAEPEREPVRREEPAEPSRREKAPA